MNEHDIEDAATMAAWITKSLDAPTVDQATRGAGYLDAMFQAAVLLRGTAFWAIVARRLVDQGVISMRHRRWTSVLESRDSITAPGGQ